MHFPDVRLEYEDADGHLRHVDVEVVTVHYRGAHGAAAARSCALFSGFAHHLERCSVCGLVYERNPGDTWAFTILGDRLPVAAMILIVYFGVFRTHRAIGIALFALLAVAVVWTTPNRWGVGIALHYFARLLSQDRDDPTPQ